MKNNKATATLISILTVILMMFAVTTTVFATDELGTLTPPAEDSEPTTVVIEDATTVTENQEENNSDSGYSDDSDDDDYDDNYVTPTEAEVVTEASTYYEVYGDELPEVESQDITEPTTMVIPDVEVSDTSLLGGVIAWLCVAVGIAVIAGVLVSQRTRQTNSQGSGRSDRRR